jgi:primosomal protein N' (replication factor Y) (superfamily II helicase)
MKHPRWRVAVALPLPAFDFAPLGAPEAGLGKRVLVPWQSGVRVGVVLEVVESTLERSLSSKDTIAVLDQTPLLDASACAALLELAKQNLVFEGLVWQDFMPFGLEPSYQHTVQLQGGVDVQTLPKQSADLTHPQNAAALDPSLLEFLRGQGLLQETVQLERESREMIRAVPMQASAQTATLTPKQTLALEVLKQHGSFPSLKSWADTAQVSTGVVTKLFEAALVRRELEPLPLRLPDFGVVQAPLQPRATELEHANTLEPESHSRLHGGKPKERFAVLAELMRRAVRRGQSVLYLAPDHQRLSRAYEVLGGIAKSAQLHGELRPLEREAVWQHCASGSVSLLFGTYLALAAPLRDLGLVVVEDEFSDAYKLHGGSRVFVPDAAQIRAQAAAAKLLFVGSVPATESLGLPGVVLRPPKARLHIVDFSAAPKAPEIGPLATMPHTKDSFPLSTDLKRLLRQTVERGRQAVLIAPRRGYSAVVRCNDCGWVPFCPHCDVPLKFHAAARVLECHQCGYHSPPPSRCPSCDGTVLSPRGPGSEWIERELKTFLPQAKIHRYDRDLKSDLETWQTGESGVLVGTTAILSLPPPPDLALVALSFADTMHSSPDFRAGERFHALLRRLLEWHPSRAPVLLVQTFNGQHRALQQILHGETADGFARAELESREAFLYPPFAQLAQVQVAARREHDSEIAASRLGGLIRDRGAVGLELLGPAPAGIARVKGLFVFQLLVRAKTTSRLAHLLEPARGFRASGVRVRVEMNPRQLTDLLE